MRTGLAWLLLALGCKGNEDVPPGGPLCETSQDCEAGLVCIAGGCSMPGTQGMGEICTASRDCMAGLWCAPGVPNASCQPAGAGDVGDACVSDGECMGGLRCELYGFSGECIEGGSGDLGDTCAAGRDCLAGLYCGASATCTGFGQAFPPWTGVDCPAPEGAYRVYFEVPRPGAPPADFFRLPFPNDIRVNPDGTLDLSDFPRPGPTPLGPDLVDLYADAWSADFQGFGSTAGVLFRFTEQIDFSTSEQPGAIRFIDVTPGPSFGGQLGMGWSYTTARNKFNCEHPLTVRNDVATPLRSGHTYAVILSRQILSMASATMPNQDDDFAPLVAAARPTGDEPLGRAWDRYQPLRDVLPMLSIDPATVAAAAVFTVQDTTGLMQRLAGHVPTTPSPVLSDLTLCDTGVTSPCDDGTPQRACGAASPDFHEIHGRYTVPIYQTGSAPYLTATDGGGIADPPQVQRTEEVCFALTIPKGATMPAGGWPLVVHAHGTGGSMRGFVQSGIAGTMAGGPVPAAVFGFDGIHHGARRGAATSRSPDGLVFNPVNPKAARDNFLQGAVDILQALRVAGVSVAAADSPTTLAISFDATRVTFFGHSQGATTGTLAAAFSDDAPAVVFSGAGSFLTASLQDKTSPVDIGNGLAFLFGETIDGSHPMMTLFQSWFERSDPINYNELIVRAPPMGIASKHVFMSYGTMDTYTPKSTLDLNAQSLGLPPVAPLQSDYGVAAISRPISLDVTGGDGALRTAAVFQYVPSGYDGHFVASDNPSAVADWLAFLSSWLATGTPTVP